MLVEAGAGDSSVGDRVSGDAGRSALLSSCAITDVVSSVLPGRAAGSLPDESRSSSSTLFEACTGAAEVGGVGDLIGGGAGGGEADG